MSNAQSSPDLARQMGWYSTDARVGAGLPLWHPDGAIVRAELEKLVTQEAIRSGAQQVYTPVLAKRELFELSGHWDKFHDDMFPPMQVGESELVLRPANCPHHAMVYASSQRSIRELPLRYAEIGAMFRSERSGVLHGLSRVRQINLDDCHVFCAPEQIGAEVALGLRAVQRCSALLGIEVAYYRLSDRDEGPGWLGSDQQWALARQQLAQGLDALGVAFQPAPGEAAFYGPKVDVQVVDQQGREMTLSTVQVDFNQPERFGLTYVDHDGSRRCPVMIHRGILSSMERMVGHLVDLHAGALPAWLCPVQVAVLPVADEQEEYARQVRDRFASAGVRVQLWPATSSLGSRVRRWHQQRLPYAAVVGSAEVATDSLALRVRGVDGQHAAPVAQFVERVGSVIAQRHLDLHGVLG